MPWGRGQCRGGVANAVGTWQGLGGVAKAVRANPNPNLNPKAVGRSQDWEHGQGRGRVAKAMEGLPRPWGRGQGCGHEA